ncbi:hypothetical protein ACFSJS_18665 [Streptomyces desertarenae]|uniref:Uncharacterized protein n=1 Tax=Streptomyces desertarenae TaxID=2666184 RepID=A0ABW4PQH4_9ACTN
MPYVAGAGTLPWHQGVTAADLAATVRPLAGAVRIENFSDDPDLWGGPVTDERYALIARV